MAKRWIAKATAGAHGQFRKKAEDAGETTRQFAKEHEADAGKTGKQARLAENLMGAAKKKTMRDMYTHPRTRSSRDG
jgi:hypothetical protein